MAASPDLHPATDELISRLAGEAHPVRRIRTPRTRFLLWLALQILVVAATGLALGLRPDAVSKLREAAFAAEIALLVTIGVVNAALALLAAIPGREPAVAAALGSLAVVLGALGVAYASEVAMGDTVRQFVAMGWPCAARTVAVAAVPWVVLLIAVRRGAPLVPGLAGVLAGIASFCIAAAELRLTCSLDARWHLLIWHLAPVAMGVSVSLAVGLYWLSRWRRRH